ncbi:hypothetical protein HYX13_04415, partial [Candidatus Woesearchaeota archaeon]|nr:hypothetical protein [Candidatus Woesearchaeota archaeon]
MMDTSKQWITRIGVILLVVVLALVFLRLVPLVGKVVGKAYTGLDNTAGIPSLTSPLVVGQKIILPIRAKLSGESVSLAFRLTYDPALLTLSCDADKIFSLLDTTFGYNTANDLTLVRTVDCSVSNSIGVMVAEYAGLCDETCSNALGSTTESEEITIAEIYVTVNDLNLVYPAIISTGINFESLGDLPDLVLYDGEGKSLVSFAGLTSIDIAAPAPADSDSDGVNDV